MKYALLLISSLFILACNETNSSSANTSTSTITEQQNIPQSPSTNNQNTPKSKEDIIKSIRTEFTAINSDNGFHKKNFNWDNDDYPNCGYLAVEMTKFISSNGDLRKIVAKLAGDGTTVTYEFYYKNNELFFIYKIITYYPPMENVEPQISEVRLYADNGKIIELLYDKEKSSNKNNLNDDSSEKYMLDIGNELRDANSIDGYKKAFCD